MSPIPGCKVIKRVKEKLVKEVKPNFNQEKLRELQREGMQDDKRTLLFSPTANSEAGSTSDSITIDVYSERNRIESETVKIQAEQFKLAQMDILRANYIQERDETEDEEEKANLTEKIKCLRKRQRVMLETNIFGE